MIRGTTPTFILHIQDESVDLSIAHSIYFTVDQNPITVTVSGAAITLQDERTVMVFLSQEETLKLKPGMKTEIQLNWTYSDPSGVLRRAATKAKEIQIEKNLLREVIS